jgi:hypothetical protein
MQKSKNRNHAETAMKPMRNHAETTAETIERNHRNHPLRGGAMVSPPPSRARHRAQSKPTALLLRYACAALRRLARPEKRHHPEMTTPTITMTMPRSSSPRCADSPRTGHAKPPAPQHPSSRRQTTSLRGGETPPHTRARPRTKIWRAADAHRHRQRERACDRQPAHAPASK